MRVLYSSFAMARVRSTFSSTMPILTWRTALGAAWPRVQWESMVRLEQILDSWKTIRADTATAVEEFPAEELDFKPCPDVMTFREIARHILIAGHGLTGLLLEGDELLGGPQFREKMAKFAILPPDA